VREHARGACGGRPEPLAEPHEHRQLDGQLRARNFERVDREWARRSQLERVGGVDGVCPLQLCEPKPRGWRTPRAHPNGRPGSRCVGGYGPDP
jgi:hypothetical protein